MVPDNVKDRGTLAELLFATEAKRRSHIVLTAPGENAAFDLVLLTKEGTFYRVQVKSCLGKDKERLRHTFTLKRGSAKTRRGYTADSVDILALHAFDDNSWYIVPMNAALGIQTIKIDENSKYFKYKDGWSTFEKQG